jgi:hypothetical protein
MRIPWRSRYENLGRRNDDHNRHSFSADQYTSEITLLQTQTAMTCDDNLQKGIHFFRYSQISLAFIV